MVAEVPGRERLAPPSPRPPRTDALPRPGRRRPRRYLAALVATGVCVLLVVAAVTVLLSGRIARENAVAEAQRTAERLAQLLVAPLLEEAMTGEAERLDELDRVLLNRMGDGSVTSVLVWTERSEVLYATDEEYEGTSSPASDELRSALDGTVVAHLGPEPEAAYGDDHGPLLEVYVPVDVGAERMVVEVYLATDSIDEQAARLRWQIVPLAVGALVLLQVVQLPIAASLSRRVRRQEAEQYDLVLRNLAASERERRDIAADVHDGPVQDLAGVSYALSALRVAVPAPQQPTVDRLVSTVRHAVASLRRLMIDIYPPDLSGPGLAAALEDLADRLRETGVVVGVTAEELRGLRPEHAAVLYRTAREALVNVAKHAAAGSARVTLTGAEVDGGPGVLLTVADDGVGLDDADLERTDGHLGLRLVRDRVQDLGGVVRVEPGEDVGTVVTALLPLPHAG
ncbi:histidine kinase/DNA gyrase B/HSP90-like ATPase [Geodermatophilus tzadiensis]|uniref:Histidine kinase/DNA gyrase B/HSP90-like ATPase n=1 Tax=Geodermatophilus tzadiensis TaxID=1137988 RepID=A0A2T0TZG7_9ACTN|nr:ATP-binding protein [Geodermatophilus tzadiensis]PRY51060.1 histidine kinase/DNA gyrase B/HSP90-like ATPase [Geodermatophilus tzadiensis]